ncbi:hypothetical protein [Marinobacter sp. CHS3-4]|uniref:hypothetical protein n=1 Tax=Marinobacter sp. CHS3-4 TaxID=3045174 RepID=UPI0024B52D7D|nr:hypothetical protein [Marinobacter sp. CHS3-4]MDI9245381.1 hypothetical protein [Marinobacter sp. CHS3-4]
MSRWEDRLKAQNRVAGVAVSLVILAVATAFSYWLDGENYEGPSLHTYLRSVDGIQPGSIIMLAGREVGAVNKVSIFNPRNETTDDGERYLDASNPMFRVDFNLSSPVSLDEENARVRVFRPSPITLARLELVQQKTEDSKKEMSPEIQSCSTRARAEDIKPPLECPVANEQNVGGANISSACIREAWKVEADKGDIGGLVDQMDEILCLARSTIFKANNIMDTLAGTTSTVDGSISRIGPELEVLISRLNQLPTAVEGSLSNIDRMVLTSNESIEALSPEVKALRQDLNNRLDLLLDPQTIESMKKSIIDFQDLVSTSSNQSIVVIENLLATTRNLSEISRRLKRDPYGFVSGKGDDYER